MSVSPFLLDGERRCGLGHQIDDVLVAWTPFVWARNLLLLQGHDGYIPRFEVEDEQGGAYIAEPGWRLRPKDKPPRIVLKAGSARIQLMVATEAEGWKQVERTKRAFVRHLRKQGVRNPVVKTRIVEMERNIFVRS